MKKILVTLLMMFIANGLMFVGNVNQNVYGSTDEYAISTNKKYIKVKVISATKEQIKLRFINTGNKDFYFRENFVLKKRIKNKWKKVKFKEIVGFRLSVIAYKKTNTTVKLRWKRFFDNNLTKGKYKIKLVRTKTFRIK